eukprot:TRINITY_DN16261_c0_g1_i1.p1 TRINITY_DN16261_c0_g1~~TRINITY_DN16261_c0_g1_i1.p1  ORF type:complete len:853 (+),score=192.25 TRINITY_DN16261_c0_g1_i1:57-2615(+)
MQSPWSFWDYLTGAPYACGPADGASASCRSDASCRPSDSAHHGISDGKDKRSHYRSDYTDEVIRNRTPVGFAERPEERRRSEGRSSCGCVTPGYADICGDFDEEDALVDLDLSDKQLEDVLKELWPEKQSRGSIRSLAPPKLLASVASKLTEWEREQIRMTCRELDMADNNDGVLRTEEAAVVLSRDGEGKVRRRSLSGRQLLQIKRVYSRVRWQRKADTRMRRVSFAEDGEADGLTDGGCSPAALAQAASPVCKLAQIEVPSSGGTPKSALRSRKPSDAEQGMPSAAESVSDGFSSSSEDSGFGLSSDQLEALLLARSWDEPSCRSFTKVSSGRDRSDSDFGLSKQQLDELRLACCALDGQAFIAEQNHTGQVVVIRVPPLNISEAQSEQLLNALQAVRLRRNGAKQIAEDNEDSADDVRAEDAAPVPAMDDESASPAAVPCMASPAEAESPKAAATKSFDTDSSSSTVAPYGSPASTLECATPDSEALRQQGDDMLCADSERPVGCSQGVSDVSDCDDCERATPHPGDAAQVQAPEAGAAEAGGQGEAVNVSASACQQLANEAPSVEHVAGAPASSSAYATGSEEEGVETPACSSETEVACERAEVQRTLKRAKTVGSPYQGDTETGNVARRAESFEALAMRGSKVTDRGRRGIEMLDKLDASILVSPRLSPREEWLKQKETLRPTEPGDSDVILRDAKERSSVFGLSDEQLEAMLRTWLVKSADEGLVEQNSTQPDVKVDGLAGWQLELIQSTCEAVRARTEAAAGENSNPEALKETEQGHHSKLRQQVQRVYAKLRMEGFTDLTPRSSPRYSPRADIRRRSDLYRMQPVSASGITSAPVGGAWSRRQG